MKLYGTPGNDSIIGTGEPDLISGGDGDDVLTGRGGRDQLLGGLGNDTIILHDLGDTHSWVIADSIGSDYCLLIGTGGGIIANSGNPEDNDHYEIRSAVTNGWLSYVGSAASIAADLTNGTASGADIGNDTVIGFCNLQTGSGDDTILGSAGDNSLKGGTGDDFISGGRGNDRLFSERGNSKMFGGRGDDICGGGRDNQPGMGNHLIYGGIGNDQLFSGVEHNVYNKGDATIYGGAGEDFIMGGEGADFMHGGLGNDTIGFVSGESDIVRGGAGADLFVWEEAGTRRDGSCRIMDFEDGVDRIDYTVYDFPELLAMAVQQGRDVVFGEFVLHNFTLAQLDASDFVI